MNALQEAWRAWSNAFDSWALAHDRTAWRIVRWDRGLEEAASSRAHNARVGIRLAPEYGASVALSLPLAAASDLDAAIALALPEAAPMPMEMLCAAWTRADVRVAEGRLIVPVMLVARTVVVEAEADARARFGRVDAIDVGREEASGTPRYDLRDGGRTTQTGPSRRLALACSVLVALGLAGLAGEAWLTRASPAAAALAERDVRAGLALAAQRAARPPAIAVVADLTDALPDSVYVEELDLDGARLSVTGRATEAGRVLSALQSKGRFAEAAFSGPMRNAGDGRQIFELTARAAPSGGK